MNFLYSEGPIIACSTGHQSNAAMAVLRISGFQSLDIFRPFFSKTGPIEPRKVYYTRLLNEGGLVDDICLTYFPGPKSYNGENTLELSVHGNTLNIERIINLFVEKAGVKLASPGEFTYRALKNKKLTLSQVEGLDLLLNANSGYALDQGLSLLNGNLQVIYQELYELYLKHKASLELAIDFSEDVGEETAKEHYLLSLKDFEKKFETLVKRVRPLEHDLIQPEITLAGLPNSGKSSLFNFLLADERAIVSPVAGTTRDYITESVVIEGVKYKLVDTAGLRTSEDVIEAEGIRRTRNKIKDGFFNILLINPLEVDPSVSELLKLNFDLIVFTHLDCEGFDEARNSLIKSYPHLGPMGAVNLLEMNRNWEKDLYSQINNKYLLLIKDKPILLSRHKNLILEAHLVLQKYVNTATYETDVAILSSELNALGYCISELLGIVSPDQVLNSIFSNFCIGK